MRIYWKCSSRRRRVRSQVFNPTHDFQPKTKPSRIASVTNREVWATVKAQIEFQANIPLPPLPTEFQISDAEIKSLIPGSYSQEPNLYPLVLMCLRKYRDCPRHTRSKAVYTVGDRFCGHHWSCHVIWPQQCYCSVWGQTRQGCRQGLRSALWKHESGHNEATLTSPICRHQFGGISYSQQVVTPSRWLETTMSGATMCPPDRISQKGLWGTE